MFIAELKYWSRYLFGRGREIIKMTCEAERMEIKLYKTERGSRIRLGQNFKTKQ